MRPARRSSTSCCCSSSAAVSIGPAPDRDRPARRRQDRHRHTQALVEVLQPILERLQKPAGIGAVDQPVIVAEREIAHRPDGDHVVDDDDALVDAADTENRDLRLTDDRQAEHRAEDARDS